MARDKQQPSPRRHKTQPDPYTSKIPKHRSEKEQTDQLKHAVTHHEADRLDDWDEPEY